MTPADYMQFVTPVLLVGIFMWMWREHREQRNEQRELRSYIDSRFDKVDNRVDKVNERIDDLRSDMHTEFRVFNKSLNELTMRVGRLEGVIMHALRDALHSDELKDSKDSQSQLERFAMMLQRRMIRNLLEPSEASSSLIAAPS